MKMKIEQVRNGDKVEAIKFIALDESLFGVWEDPNNPNGGILDKIKFKDLLNYCEENKKTVIVDEAFIEFTGDNGNSVINDIEKYNCLIIIKAIIEPPPSKKKSFLGPNKYSLSLLSITHTNQV